MFAQKAYTRQINHRRPSFCRGFTLIELMVTVTIAAIIMAMAYPDFGAWIKGLRLSKASNELYTSLIQARNEALRIQSRVSLCRTGNVYPADPSCQADIYSGGTNASKQWTYGWLVYTSENLGIDYVTTTDRLIAAINSGVDDDKVIITSNDDAQNHVTFGPDGRIQTGSPQIAICDDRNGGEFGYLIEFTANGRAIATKFSDHPDYPDPDIVKCTPP